MYTFQNEKKNKLDSVPHDPYIALGYRLLATIYFVFNLLVYSDM